MSGWIKFEKDLLTDPRVLRVAKTLSNRFKFTETISDSELFEACNDHALPAVTLVCGALARLWVLADTHIGSDNVLPLGCDELNDILGIPGFCESLPEDWLVIIDDSHVQLPEFHEHNGTEAKKKAVTQKRVSRWRNKQNEKPLHRRNGRALPDQDQTKTITTASATPTRKRVPRETDPSWLLDFKLAYPERAGDQGWRKAVKAANARLAEGHTVEEFIEGAKRYAAYCAAQGKVGTEFVKQAATFLGPDKPFLETWDIPPPKGSQPANWRDDPRFKGVVQ